MYSNPWLPVTSITYWWGTESPADKQAQVAVMTSFGAGQSIFLVLPGAKWRQWPFYARNNDGPVEMSHELGMCWSDANTGVAQFNITSWFFVNVVYVVIQ